MSTKRHNMHHHKNLQQGLSLVELMVAISLGLFLVWGVTQSFLGSKQVYRMEQGLSRIQENGRLAQEFIGYDIRNAGNYGCASGDNFIQGTATITNEPDSRVGSSTGVCTGGVPPAAPVTAVTSPPAAAALATDVSINRITNNLLMDDEYEYAVYGWNNVPSAVNFTAPKPVPQAGVATILLGRPPKAGTDVLMVQTSEDAGALLAGVAGAPPVGDPVGSKMASPTQLTVDAPIQLRNTAAIRDRIAVGDCGRIRIFAVQDMAVPGTVINLVGNGCTSSAFQVGATVRKLNAVYYFVADNGRLAGGGPSYSLYRQENNVGVAEELLEGVEDMQLTFGVDTNGDSIVDAWEDAATVSATPAKWNGWDWLAAAGTKDMNLVRAVRYSLLMRTEEDHVLNDEQQISFNGVTLFGGAPGAGAGDRRLRQVFTSTVAIRSRNR